MSFTYSNRRVESIKFISFLSAAFLLLIGASDSSAQNSREFTLNEKMHEALAIEGAQPACDAKAVLRDLLKQIGKTANVYPTENYYYFKFYRAGKSFSGSLRLAVGQRDRGILQLACYRTFNSWTQHDNIDEVVTDLGSEDGVTVTKMSDLKFRVSIDGFATVFNLNNLTQTPVAELHKGEAFVGRIFDDSGLIFNLLYDTEAKNFIFVLSQDQNVPDAFFQKGKNTYIGKRTGFVFHKSNFGDYILVAVNEHEVLNNTWNDGPFDHLPENFYEQLHFWDYIFDAYPEMRGKVTKEGVFVEEPNTIFALSPYRSYKTEEDLDFIENCSKGTSNRTDLIKCFMGQL